MKVEANPFVAKTMMAWPNNSATAFIEFYSIPPSNLFHAGPLESVVEKVKDALGIDTDPVDENILEYCSLDQTVSAFRSQSSQPAFHIWTSSPQSLTC